MKMRLPNGLTVHAFNKAETRYVYREIFEGNIYLKHGIELREGDRVFDVGANMGLFSVYLNQNLRDFALYAFEPIPRTFEVLRRNTAPFADSVRLFNLGLSGQDGPVVFTHYTRTPVFSTRYPELARSSQAAAKKALLEAGDRLHNGHNTMVRRARKWIRPLVVRGLFHYASRHREIVCQMKTLSRIVAENTVDRIDLLKLDVEGSEWDVLQGIEERDWPKIKQIVMEVHPIQGGVEQISGCLTERGYQVAIDQEDDFRTLNIHMLYARR